jgi:SAM-dependent methyltransferase
MPSTGFDERTLRFYAEEAPVYAASGPGGASRHLASFLDRLKPGVKILELGCGGGRDSEAMIARGYDVDPTDGVVEIARQAEQRIGRTVRVMRFDQLQAEESYDAVWAHASLLHVPRTDLPAILCRIHRALKPGGFHFANYKGGGTEGRDGFSRYFNYFSRDQLIDIYLGAAPWSLVDVNEYEGGGYQERKLGPWIAVTVRKPAAG